MKLLRRDKPHWLILLCVAATIAVLSAMAPFASGHTASKAAFQTCDPYMGPCPTTPTTSSPPTTNPGSTSTTPTTTGGSRPPFILISAGATLFQSQLPFTVTGMVCFLPDGQQATISVTGPNGFFVSFKVTSHTPASATCGPFSAAASHRRAPTVFALAGPFARLFSIRPQTNANASAPFSFTLPRGSSPGNYLVCAAAPGANSPCSTITVLPDSAGGGGTFTGGGGTGGGGGGGGTGGGTGTGTGSGTGTGTGTGSGSGTGTGSTATGTGSVSSSNGGSLVPGSVGFPVTNTGLSTGVLGTGGVFQPSGSTFTGLPGTTGATGSPGAAAGTGGAASGISNSPAASSSASGSKSRTAFSGANVLWLVLVALAFMALGWYLFGTGRRRLSRR